MTILNPQKRRLGGSVDGRIPATAAVCSSRYSKNIVLRDMYLYIYRSMCIYRYTSKYPMEFLAQTWCPNMSNCSGSLGQHSTGAQANSGPKLPWGAGRVPEFPMVRLDRGGRYGGRLRIQMEPGIHRKSLYTWHTDTWSRPQSSAADLFGKELATMECVECREYRW